MREYTTKRRHDVRGLGFLCLALAAFPVLAADKTWTGAVSDEWNTSHANWKDAGGGAVAFGENDTAIFDGTASRRAIRLTDRVSPTRVVFNTDADLFITNSVTGVIMGSNYVLEKRGTGTVLLKNINNFNMSTNDIHIYGGTLKTDSPNMNRSLGDPAKGYHAFIHDGGTLWISERNSIGAGYAVDYSGNNAMFTVYTNGVLSFANGTSNDSNINQAGSIILDGGTLILPTYGHSSGALRVQDLFSFAGPTPYVFNPNTAGGSSAAYRLNIQVGTNTEFRVADITDDERADVTFNNPVVAFKALETGIVPNGFRKTGAGKMVLAGTYVNDTEVCSPSGRITVEDGELEYVTPYLLGSKGKGAITIASNATLRVHGGMFIDPAHHKTNDIPRPVIIADGGRLVLEDLAAQYTFGDLSLPATNAVNIWDIPGHPTVGVLSLMGKVTFGGTNVWTLASESFPVAKANGGSAFRNHTAILLGPACSPTDFCVPDITGDTNVDLTVTCRVRDTRDMDASTYQKAGFVKTGAGTMVLGDVNHTDNIFTGDVDVREGTLVVGAPTRFNAYPANRTQSLLGDLSVENRTITVSGGGTIWFPNYNALFSGTVEAITNDPAKTSSWSYSHLIAKDGGTFRFTAHEQVDRIEFSNGYLRGFGRNGGYGVLQVLRQFKVSGTQAFEDGGNIQEPDDPNTFNDPTTHAILVNGEPQVEFDIADVTGDMADDATFYRALAISYRYKRFYLGLEGTPPRSCGEWKFGFRKTGVGTMRLATVRQPAAPTSTSNGDHVWPLNGTIAVEAGELKVDTRQTSLERVEVAAGAYLSGTGAVTSVTLADGAGLRVDATGTTPLTVTGDFAFGTTGRIEIRNPVGVDKRRVRAKILKIDGAVTGAENLRNWKIAFNGEEYSVSDWVLDLSDGKLGVRFARGVAISFR